MKKLTFAFAAILAASCATAASAAMYTDFESYKSFELGGNPVYAFDDAADVWVGEWSGGGTTADTVTAEIAEGAGFNGSKALKVQSSGHENVGLYLFATADNGIVTDHTGAAYLRVWADFSEVDFRKANFGTTDSTYSLFSTDEVDTNWECKYYFSADGANWEEYVHGDDGCFGTAQAGTVYGMKGWFAFPVADFTIRSNANWEAYDEQTPANPADISGVYLFWDYDDATAAETPFYLDNLEFVADYKVFDYDAGAGAAAATEAPAAEAPAAEEAPAADAPALQNYCLGATVTEVSGLETEGTNTGDMAIDGDLATRWASNTDDAAHIIVDIGSPLPIGYVEIHWETACAQDYTIETSSDGTSWDVKATVTGNTKGTSPASADCIAVHEWEPATARFIKINCTKRNTEWGNSIWEIVARKAVDTVESTAPAAYPASGTEVPADSVLINGARIGLEEGWGGNAAAGRDAAFDGDVNTFFDPLGTGDGWCGVDAGEEMILTKIVIHPRDAWAARFNGATIEGANEEDFSDAVALYLSVEEAGEVTFLDVSDEIEEADNTGYRYFRYINYTNHGDVAEVELYGKAVDGSNPTYGAAEAPAATEAPAAEAAPAADVIAIEAYDAYQEYPAVDVLANSGAGYATLEEAAAAIGKTPITGYTFISGTTGNGNEGPEMLWDNDTATKFCTSEFPTTTIAAADGEYTIDGIIMATANDNSSYNNRSPYEWCVYGSNDGATWTALAYGDDYFFEEVDFTYFAAPVTTEGSYKYFMFQSEGALSGCFQVSELVLCGTKVETAAPVVEEPVAEEPVVEEPVVEEPVVEEPVLVEETVEEVVVEEPVVEEVVVEEEVAEEAAQTFDFGVIAAVAAAISAAGFAISKKR